MCFFFQIFIFKQRENVAALFDNDGYNWQQIPTCLFKKLHKEMTLNYPKN
jgi:hypothetical protein